MQMSREKLERVLERKSSSWAGSAAVMPLLLAIILLGTISFKTERHHARVVEKFLSPPLVKQREQMSFEETVSLSRSQRGFEDIELIEDVPEVQAKVETPTDLPEIEMVQDDQPAELAMADVPDNLPNYLSDSPEFEVAGSVQNDASNKISTRPDPNSLRATMVRASSGPARQGGGSTDQKLPGAGVVTGSDRSGAVTADPGPGEAVMVQRPSGGSGSGVGVSTPASGQKDGLSAWILANQSHLRPAIQEALDYNDIKGDATAKGSVVDQEGQLYQMFFLHRTENNLLRILVVVDDKAYRIDLPHFYLEANHVKVGSVSRGAPPADSFDPGPIIEVSLQAVDAIPAEVPGIFDMVLGWLEIKGTES